MTVKKINLAEYIDHTLLKPEATQEQIEKLCQQALDNSFFSVCVNSHWVPLCKKLLINSSVKVCAVVGFPLGAMSAEAKAFETDWCVQQGADEIDMVINVGELKSKNLSFVEMDIKKVVQSAHTRPVKVIIETSLLTYDEKILACQASLNSNAAFVKTSTGFNGGGATVEDIVLMKSIVGDHLKIKASGGIKNQKQAIDFINMGVHRLGTSSGVDIIKGQVGDAKSY